MYEIEMGGSGTGLSHYKQALSCAYKAMLEKGLADMGQHNTDKNLLIGTFLHAFMELYYGKQIDREVDTSTIEFSHVGYSEEELCRQEAERLFRAYRTQFPPTELGRVLAVEEFVDASEADVPWKPPGLPLTMRCDLVVSQNKADCKRIAKSRSLRLPPGRRIVDWKSASGLNPITIQSYMHGLQFMGYPLMWNWAHPKKPVDGTIVCMLTKTSPVKFFSFYIPLPDEERQKVLYSALCLARNNLEDPQPNPTQCFSYAKRCAYMEEQCKRY